MGKGSGRLMAQRLYVVKLDMHCQCNVCVKKIKDGAKKIGLSEGVERADVSAETREVTVTGGVDMDPEKLCSLLQEATKKKCARIVKEESVPSPGSGRIARPGQNQEHLSVCSGAVKSQTGWLQRLLVGGDEMARAPSPQPPRAPCHCLCRRRSETTAPSERCRYRWAAPGSTLGVWAASEITGTLAMYEL